MPIRTLSPRIWTIVMVTSSPILIRSSCFRDKTKMGHLRVLNELPDHWPPLPFNPPCHFH